ncbi:MAG: hypothetical protein ACAI44_33105, partial [Candidatus Sericytochromatia bacterium]
FIGFKPVGGLAGESLRIAKMFHCHGKCPFWGNQFDAGSNRKVPAQIQVLAGGGLYSGDFR